MMRPVVRQGAGARSGWGDWHRRGRTELCRTTSVAHTGERGGRFRRGGTIGIAGGVFMMRRWCCPAGAPVRIAIGTSSLMVALTALAGRTGHLATGSFDIVIALPLAAVAFVGGRLRFSSSLIQRKHPPHDLASCCCSWPSGRSRPRWCSEAYRPTRSLIAWRASSSQRSLCSSPA